MSTQELKARAQQLGVDVNAPDWLSKLIAIVQLIMDLFKSQPSYATSQAAGCDDHEALSCAAVCAAAQSLQAAILCHQACCEA